MKSQPEFAASVSRRYDTRADLLIFPACFLIVMFCVGVMLARAQATVSDGLKWCSVTGQSIALQGPAGVIWKFNYNADLSKPHFHPIATPRGDVLTWNQPPDHAWHHALWFSWKEINGVNYWEENAGEGMAAGRTTWSDVRIETNDNGSASIGMTVTYRPMGGTAVLTEQRLIRVSAPQADGQYTLDWTSRFTAAQLDVILDRTPIPPDPEGKSWGGYAGLSVRFAQDFVQREALSSAGPVAFGQDGVHRSSDVAMDYTGTINGRAAGIAIFDHPENPRHPTPWYLIRADMTYLNAAFLTHEAFKLPASESMTLRYRIVVHTEGWTADTLRAEYNAYVSTR